VTSPRRRFEEALEDLLEAGRPVSSHLLQDLESKHDAWWAHVRGPGRSRPEEGYFVGAPTPWEEILGKLERRCGFEPEPTVVVEPEPEPVANNPPQTRSRRPLPLKNEGQLAYYTHAKLARVARELELKGHTQGAVARHTEMPVQDVRRVRLLLNAEMALIGNGELVLDVTLKRKGTKYALRYLNEDATAWLDPNRQLQSL
jgi:hypothetical protein